MRHLYLHGFASGPASGKAQWFRRRLAGHGIELEIPDLAAGDFEHLTVTGQLRVIEELVRGEAVSLIGSSMGGYLAALYASRHPEVQKLVLLAPAFGLLARWPETLGSEVMESWRQTGSRHVFHYAENREVPLSFDLMRDAALYPAEPSFTQPALVVHGRADDVVPVAASIEFARRHPNVRLEVLDSDHQLTDAVDRMAELMVPLLLR